MKGPGSCAVASSEGSASCSQTLCLPPCCRSCLSPMFPLSLPLVRRHVSVICYQPGYRLHPAQLRLAWYRPARPTNAPSTLSWQRFCQVPSALSSYFNLFTPFSSLPPSLSLPTQLDLGVSLWYVTHFLRQSGFLSLCSLTLSSRQVQRGLPWTALWPVCPQDRRHPVRSKYVQNICIPV